MSLRMKETTPLMVQEELGSDGMKQISRTMLGEEGH
jgi:hypothetical protein